MTNRSTTYTLDVTVNGHYNETDHNHSKIDFEDLMTILDGYVVGTGDECSWIFTVVKHEPKDWVVVGDPDHEAEVFGPFPDRDKAIEWAKQEFPTDTDWIVRGIDKPIVDKPKPELTSYSPSHRIEGTQENFNRYIAGDR